MSTIGDRMQWMPGEPSANLELGDVLLALGVLDRPEPEQREAVQRALSAGDLGAPSLAALSAAGWLATSVPAPAAAAASFDEQFEHLDEELGAREAGVVALRDTAWRSAVLYRLSTVAAIAAILLVDEPSSELLLAVLLLPGVLILMNRLTDMSVRMGQFDAALEEYVRVRRELNRLRASREDGPEARATFERLRDEAAFVDSSASLEDRRRERR